MLSSVVSRNASWELQSFGRRFYKCFQAASAGPVQVHPSPRCQQSFQAVSQLQFLLAKNAGFRIRIRIGSVFNRASGSVSGSVFGVRIRIQEGKNDPQK